MSIPVVCPKCSAKLNAPESAAGKKVKCPKCQTGVVVPTPPPEEPAFEVVEDAPAKKPAAVAKPVVKPKVKADVTADDGGDETPRKKRVPAEIEDDEKPRKKLQAESDEDDEDDRPRKKKKQAAGNSTMTRNIIGGVVLLVLLGVAGWVFYDKFGNKDDDTAGNTNPNPPPMQPGSNPGQQGGPDRPRPSGGSGGQSVWTPDPNLVNELKQKAEVGGYQISLPQQLTPVQTPVELPPHIQMGAWVAKTAGGEPAGIVSLGVFSDAQMLGEANKNMRQTLVNFSAGVADTSGIKITSRGPTETGLVNGLRFTRFAFSGTTPNRADMRGLVYGAVDENRVVAIVGMGFGTTAEVESKRLESVIATTKKR